MLRHAWIAAIAVLLNLASLPVQAGAGVKVPPLSMGFEAQLNPMDLTTSLDLKLYNHLGYAVEVFGDYRFLLGNSEVRQGSFDMSRGPRFEVHEQVGAGELPTPLPVGIVTCAIVEYTMRTVDRHGRVREIDDALFACRQLAIVSMHRGTAP